MSNPLESFASFLESQRAQYRAGIAQCEQNITQAKQVIADNTAQTLMFKGALADSEATSKHLGETSDAIPDELPQS